MRLRELRLDDYTNVVAVLGRNGLRWPSPSQWEYLWSATPHPEHLRALPAGWILEHDRAGVVGTFRNIPVLYEWNRRPVRVAIASAWAVDVAHRRHSLMLAAAYFKQIDADVLLNTTAVAETSGKAFLAFRAERVPQPTYTTRFLWITGYRGFAANLVRERRLPGALQYPTALAAWVVDAAGRATTMLTRNASDVGVRTNGPDAVRLAPQFDERFDRFWANQRERRDRLQAVRDAATLKWRFALERVPPLLVVLERGGELMAYALLVRRDLGTVRRCEVADLQAADDEPALLQSVMDGALRLAREHGVHLVALSGHCEAKRRALLGLRPHAKTAPGWPLYYKAVDPSLTDALRPAAAWDLSLYDGDALWSATFESS